MNKRGFLASLLSIIVAASLLAQADPLNFVQTGTATHDLDSEDLVAAHSILPIGQEVLVTNLESGAQVTVTITERIGSSSSRIIDLSSAAAAELVMFDDTGQVTIEATLKRDAPADTAPAAAAPATADAPAATTAPATPPAAPATPPAAPAAVTAPAPPAASATPPAAPAAATAPAPPAASAAVPGAAIVTEAPVISPAPSTEYTPTSEITPVVPPWETGYVPWPAPQNDPWLPELAQPWIAGIEREQRSPRALGPAQTPAPAFAPPPVSSPPVAPAAQTPAPQAATRGGPSAKALPKVPGAGDSALYRVQVGAFSARGNAQEAFNRLLNAGFSPVFEVQGRLTKVQIPWVRGYEVSEISRRLYAIGFREVWIRSEQ